MKIQTFVIPVEHLDECSPGRNNKIKKVLASEFISIPEGDRVCRIVCEVK